MSQMFEAEDDSEDPDFDDRSPIDPPFRDQGGGLEQYLEALKRAPCDKNPLLLRDGIIQMDRGVPQSVAGDLRRGDVQLRLSGVPVQCGRHSKSRAFDRSYP